MIFFLHLLDLTGQCSDGTESTPTARLVNETEDDPYEERTNHDLEHAVRHAYPIGKEAQYIPENAHEKENQQTIFDQITAEEFGEFVFERDKFDDFPQKGTTGTDVRAVCPSVAHH